MTEHPCFATQTIDTEQCTEGASLTRICLSLRTQWPVAACAGGHFVAEVLFVICAECASFYTKKRKLQPLQCLPQVYGPESSGKTTLALHAIAEVQRQGGVAALIDAEHAFDPEYSRVRVPIVLSQCLAAAYRVARVFAHHETPQMCLFLLTFNFTS